MTRKSENPSVENHPRKGMFDSPGESRQTISPAERWLLITEKAYSRAQRRGFVGGDPFDDWTEAEREVDAVYDTDTRRVFAQADAEQLIEQVKSTFGGYGLGHLHLDAILEKHRVGLEMLAEQNRKLMKSTSELAVQQSALFQEAVNDAMDSLHSFTRGKVGPDGFAKQAELSRQALENVLSYLQDLTKTATEVSSLKRKGDNEK